MARRTYTSRITRTAGTAADALQRLRDLEIVDRFTGATLTDNSGDVDAAFTSSDGGNVTLTTSVGTANAGSYAFIGKTITLGAGGRLIAGPGVHFHFFNCNIIVQNATNATAGSPISTGSTASAADDVISGTNTASVALGAAATRSVNFYGCGFTATNDVALSNSFFQFSDAFNTTVAFSSRVHVGYYVAGDGSRLINVTQSNQYVNNVAFTSLWGTPEIVEGVDNNAAPWFNPAVANSIVTLLEPTFSAQAGGSVQRYRLQSDGSATDQTNAYFQNIGFTTPNGNAEADAFIYGGSGTSTAGTYFNFFVNSGGTPIGEMGGAVNYYTWNPSYHQDVARTQGIQGVRVRTRTGFDLIDNRFTVNNGTATNIAAGMIADTSTINKTGDALDRINEYITDGNGLVVADANSRFSANGGTSWTTGWIDWLQMGARNAASTTTGGNSTGTGFGGVEVPNNHIIAPIQFIGKDAYNQYSTSYEARSYSHDINIIDEQDGRVSSVQADIDAGQQPQDALVPIQDAPLVGANLIGNRIKTTNVNAVTNLPDISFAGGSTDTASLQDFSNIARAVWAEYGFNPTDFYGTDPGDIPNAGPFDERDWGLRPVISTSDPSGDSDATVIASGTGWSVRNHSSGGQLRIAVWAPGGLAADADNDIDGQNPTRINSHNNGGTPLVGSTIETPGGAINFSRIEDSTVHVSGGEIEFDPQRTSTADTFIRGTVSLSNTNATNSNITNFPRVAGRPSLEDNWTILDGNLRTDDNAQGGTGSSNDPGIWDGSVWNNGTTMSAVTINKLTGDFTIAGGSHSFVLTNAPAVDLTWTFTDSPTLAINLPAASPTGLVRFETNNQLGDTTQYDIVQAWLDAEGVTYSNVRLDETAPTTGYWLPAPPLAPATPSMININGPRTGFFISKVQGTAGIGTVIDLENDTYDDADLIPNQDTDSTTTYDVWYLPFSTVNGVAGATANVTYDFTYAEWKPADGNLTLLPTQIDADGVIITGLTSTTYNASTIVPAASLDNGIAQFNITSAATSYNAQEGQAIAVKLLQSRLYLECAAFNNLDNSERLIVFGQLETVTYNGGDLVTDREFIRFGATGTQRVIGGGSGFLSTEVTAGGLTVATVSSASLINAIASLETVASVASGLSEQAFDDTMDQINAKINTSSLGIPTSGDLT